MATSIATTTSSTALGPRGQAQTTTNGVKWVAFSDGTKTAFYYDNGGGWTEHTPSMSLTGHTQPNLFIDADDYAHLVLVNGTNAYYYRGQPNAGRTDWTWSSAYTLSYGSRQYNPQVVAHREGTGWKAHIVWNSRYYYTTGTYWYRCRCTAGTVYGHSHTTCGTWTTVYQDCTCYTGVCQGPGTHSHPSTVTDIGAGCNAWPTQPGYNAAGYIEATAHTHGCAGYISDSYFEQTGGGYSTYVVYRRYDISSGQTISQDTNTVTDSFGGTDTGLAPTIDFAHTGDGKTASATPSVYITFNASSYVYRRRMAYSGGTWVDGGRVAVSSGVTERRNYGAWKGDTSIIAWRDPSFTDQIQVRSVNDSGTVTALASTPAYGSVINRLAVIVGTNNLYALVNTDTEGVFLSVYDGSWGPWNKVVDTGAVTAVGTFMSADRHLVNDSLWFVYEVGAGSPYTVYEHSEYALQGGGWGLLAIGG